MLIVIAHGEYVNVYHAVGYRIYKAVLLGNTTRPFALQIMFQRFGFSYTGEGVCLDIC